MRPSVIDIYTSPKGSNTRKNYFYPGDSIQFNAIHTTIDGFPEGETYNIFWTLDFWGNGAAVDDGGAFEVVYRPIIIASGTFTYRFRTTHNFWWFDEIPFLGDPLFRVEGTNRSEYALFLSEGRGNQIFIPGLWKLTATIKSSLDIDMPLSTATNWFYGISRHSRLI